MTTVLEVNTRVRLATGPNQGRRGDVVHIDELYPLKVAVVLGEGGAKRLACHTEDLELELPESGDTR